MKTWTSVLALLVATLVVTAPALAQASAPKGRTGDSGAQSPSAPSASPGDSGSKSDAMKSDPSKSDTMKSEAPKSSAGKAERGSSGANREQVRAAQQALKGKGHDPGAIDGVMGPETEAALKDFQKAEGLEETGRLDAETTAKLGIEGKTSGAESSTTPAASPKTGASSPSATGGASSSPPSAAGGTAPSDTSKQPQGSSEPSGGGTAK